jgi:hypothetical protein
VNPVPGWENAGSILTQAQHFFSCVHLPLFDDEDDVPTMFIVTPSELHLLIGPVNLLYKELCSRWSGAEAWTKACHVQPAGLHGGKLVSES